MKKIYLLFFLLLISCKIQTEKQSTKSIKNVIKIESVLISNDVDFRGAVSTEFKFDSYMHHKKTVSFETENIDLDLGKEVSLKYIDIKTKVTITKKNGIQEKLYINHKGIISYNDKFYSGSRDIMLFLRGNIENFEDNCLPR
jgi:hypothetical protein